MNHPNLIKILAALTAAPRWAIALMPADGAPFPWSQADWFVIVSGIMSLCFAVVEIWAASFIMRAWHEAQASNDTILARNLRRLWVTTLIVLAAALVPPMYANVIQANINTFAAPVVLAWLICVAASTFLVIGGVGYADHNGISQPASEPIVTAQATPTSKPVEIPAFLAPLQETHTEQLAPITDHFVRSIWLAKKANAPFADIEVQARECLNGTSEALETWLATGKQSMTALADLLGVASEDRGVFDTTCRGLRKPNGTVINRTAHP